MEEYRALVAEANALALKVRKLLNKLDRISRIAGGLE